MNTLLTLLTICLVVIIYMHVVFQLTTSNDLEIFELDTPSKIKLEEVCNLRQPFLFNYHDDSLSIFPKLMEYKTFDVTVYDASYNSSTVSINNAFQLFDKKNYITMHNSDFLQETMLSRQFMNTNAYLRPPMVVSTTYDILMGAEGSTTRLEYNNQYRNYFYVSNGAVTIKLTPPKNEKYLNVEKDYAKQCYYSNVHPWNTTLDKVKFLELSLIKGQMLFIPAYWWYSIKFEKESCVCTFQYKTGMNIIATLPDICMGILQRQNTKTKLKLTPAFHVNPSSSDASRTSGDHDEHR